MRARILLTAAMVALAALTIKAEAAYPDRPITMIVPWAAGGGTDIIARIFSAGLHEEVGVPVNVVNRTGGSGVVGHATIAAATPDGYTLGVGSPELTFLKTVGLGDVSVDKFTLISRLGVIPAGVTVAADAPWKTLADLVADLKSHPAGTYTASGSGQGGAWHIALAGMLASLGLPADQVRWVPSQGGAPALQDVMAGGITMFTGSPVEARSLIEAGKVRTLAVMIEQRSPTFPDVPTLKEAVGSDWTYANWFALIGPKGLPDDVIATLEKEGPPPMPVPRSRRR